jgi:DNA-binding LytR/AlgR family response regulator
MNVLIIEDEHPSFLRLQRMLTELDATIHVMGPLVSNAEVRTFFAQPKAIDLIFSDIRLLDGDVFSSFEEAKIECPVIFTTAYDEYALKAFKFNSVDYLLKPIVKEELAHAVSKWKGWRNGRVLLVGEYRGIHYPVSLGEVSHIQLEAGTVRLSTRSGQTLKLDMTLDELEAELAPTQFFRATRQLILHKEAVKSFSYTLTRKLSVALKDYPEQRIEVSKEKAAAFKKWMTE